MHRTLTLSMILLTLASPALAETVHMGVDGLICAFCAAGIEKSLKKDASVESAQVDLDAKRVTIHTKPAQAMHDATLTRIVTDAGYKVTSIHHQP